MNASLDNRRVRFGTTLLRRIGRQIDSSPAGKLFQGCKTTLVARCDPVGTVDGTDGCIAAVFAVVAAGVSIWAFGMVPTGPYGESGSDIWFQADQPRVIDALSSTTGWGHYRDSVHPLFSLLAYPPVALLRWLGLPAVTAAETFVVTVGCLCVAFLYLTLRRLDSPRHVAATGCAAFLSSATFLHWFSIVETYSLTSLTVVLTVYLFSGTHRIRAHNAIVGLATALCMMLTNLVLGLALAAAKLKLSRFLSFSIAAFAICAVLSLGQRQIFPQALYFFDFKQLTTELLYVDAPDAREPTGGSASISEKLRGVLLTPAVAPRPYVYRSEQPDSRVMLVSNQSSALPTYGVAGGIAAAAWLLGLCLSTLSLVTRRRLTPTAFALMLFLLSQVVLHQLYGEITFLYAGNFFPALIILQCLGATARRSWLMLIPLLCFIICGSIANVVQFRAATELAHTLLARHPGNAELS